MSVYVLTQLTREQWVTLLQLCKIAIKAAQDAKRDTDLFMAMIAEIDRTIQATPELRGEDR